MGFCGPDPRDQTHIRSPGGLFLGRTCSPYPMKDTSKAEICTWFSGDPSRDDHHVAAFQTVRELFRAQVA